MPEVSVVIPLYNKAPHIERALRSVLAQTFQDFEMIVVDDGSTDNGSEIVKGILDARIRLIQQENAGVSAARNKGIETAESELIAFLDADDAWKPQYLETILRLRKKFPEAGAYATAYQVVTPSGKVVIPKFEGIPPSSWEGLIPSYFRSALGPLPVWTSAVAIPMPVLLDIGKFAVGEHMGEDLDMWGRIALKYPIAFSWHIGSTYFTNANNRACRTYSYFVERETPFVRTARQAIHRGEVPSDILADLKEYTAKLQIAVAFLCLLRGHRPEIARRITLNSHPKTIRIRRKKYCLYFYTLLPTVIISSARWVKRKIFGEA